MFTKVAITGLGPHETFSAALDPRGMTRISGPSESGKSFIIEAVFFGLWGRSTTGKFPLEAIRDGHDHAAVELHLDSGRVLRRTVNRSRQQQREIRLVDRVERFSTDAKFAAALGELGADEEVVRLIMAPLTWPPLVAANARKFRDILSRILPKGDVVGEVRRRMTQAGVECSPKEAAGDEKHLIKVRADTRRALEQARGRTQTLAERLAELAQARDEVPGVDEQRLVHRIALWRDYDRHRDAMADTEALRGAQKVWDERRAALGEPPHVSGALPAVVSDFEDKRRALEIARANARELTSRRRHLVATFESLGADHDPSTCPTCLRPGWEDGSRAHSEAIAERAALDQALASATEQGLKLRAAAERAEERVERVRAEHAAVERYEVAISALGPRPNLGEGPPELALEPPDVPRPTAQELETVAQNAAARGAREQRQRDLQRVREEHAQATERERELEAEAQRLNVLVEAVRAAPSQVASEMALALGELGPVSLIFGDNPAVQVHVDGRPWWLASRGRLVVADAYLRAALRRVSELDHVPLFIDNVQDVGGQALPQLPTPVVLLRTNDEADLRVEQASSA